MSLFGAPMIFCTPNLADTKQPLLLVVEGVEVRLVDSEIDATLLPTYRTQMQRLARDPVGQTIVFELVMRLFFMHILGVRWDTAGQRRRATPASREHWWDWSVSYTHLTLPTNREV